MTLWALCATICLVSTASNLFRGPAAVDLQTLVGHRESIRPPIGEVEVGFPMIAKLHTIHCSLSPNTHTIFIHAFNLEHPLRDHATVNVDPAETMQEMHEVVASHALAFFKRFTDV